MQSRLWAVAVAAILPALTAAAADLGAAKELAAPCESCHGLEGMASDPTIPWLAGQHEQFLQWQLVFFRNGRRANDIMGPIAAELADTDIRSLAAYYASLPATEPPAADIDETLRQKGEELAQSHRCAACHMPNYAGRQAAPALAGQRKAYLAQALADYRSAARPSTGVAAMNEAAATLSDQDIQALAQFLEAYR